MSVENRRDLIQILSLNQDIPSDWQILKTEYQAVDIDKVVIDGDTYTNYGDFQFMWEKTYVQEPKRSGNGAIGNLNAYATFIVPHLIINFSIMSIDDYRRIMQKDLALNEFVVECYDPIYNKKTINKMYFSTLQMAKLNKIARKRFNGSAWEDWIELVGVNEYTVEMVGTLSELDTVSVVYHSNFPNGLDETQGEEDVYRGEELIIGTSTDIPNNPPNSYKFTKWNTKADGTGSNYINGNAYTINSNLILYAIWESTNEHNLAFSYGLSDPSTSGADNEFSRKVVEGKSVGILPILTTPVVEIDKKYYLPYSNAGWYKTPIKAPNSRKLSNNEMYWTNTDSVIYALYDVAKYQISFYIDGQLSQSAYVEYNQSVQMPTVYPKTNYTFDGWYTTSDFKKDTKIGSLSMPPYNTSLYGRWVENK